MSALAPWQRPAVRSLSVVGLVEDIDLGRNRRRRSSAFAARAVLLRGGRRLRSRSRRLAVARSGVDAEGRGLAGRRHARRSPIRNCNARSSRMCGSDSVTPSAVRSSFGGRKRTKRTRPLASGLVRRQRPRRPTRHLPASRREISRSRSCRRTSRRRSSRRRAACR